MPQWVNLELSGVNRMSKGKLIEKVCSVFTTGVNLARYSVAAYKGHTVNLLHMGELNRQGTTSVYGTKSGFYLQEKYF